MGCKQAKIITITVLIPIIALISGQEPTAALTEEPENDYNMLTPTEPFEETTKAQLDNVDFSTNVIEILENTIRELETPADAYRFVQSKGVERIIEPILLYSGMNQIGPVLVICKRLFQLIPRTASTVIPYSYLEKVLDLFQANMSPEITKQAVEVITLWLLQNPGAQTHVIKVKGLYQFYEILPYLNIDDVGKMLSLFRQLIKEHKEVRGEVARLRFDETRQNMYTRIGLLELVESYETCLGLVKLYEEYLPEWDKLIIEIIDLIKITKEYCSDKYHERDDVIKTFKKILEYISDDTNIFHFETIGLNPMDAEIFLRKYLNEMRQKSEL